MFELTADLYDLIYSHKDYERESVWVRDAVRARVPAARTLLDVACGTGKHLEILRRDFECQGLDLNARFVEIAAARTGVPVHLGDMDAFDLGSRFDVVTCLFSAVGYTHDLHGAIASMARHVAPGGVLIVEPWFRLEQWNAGRVYVLDHEGDGTRIVRMGHSRLEGNVSVMEMHHLVGTAAGVEHLVETHRLTCFGFDEYEAAFRAAGLSYEEEQPGPTGQRRAHRPGLAPGPAVDELAEDVGVAGVPGCLLEQVHQDPAQVHGRLVTGVAAHVVEVGRRDDRVDPHPGRAVRVHRGLERVVGPHRVVGAVEGLTGETVHDPQRLGARDVLHQPEQRRTAADEQTPSGFVVETFDLPHERLALILQQGEERVALAADEARRLHIGHGRHRTSSGNCAARARRRRNHWAAPSPVVRVVAGISGGSGRRVGPWAGGRHRRRGPSRRRS